MSSVSHFYFFILPSTVKKDYIAALHHASSRDPREMECTQKASDTSTEQFEKLSTKIKFDSP